MTIAAGTRLNSYQVISSLGAGGMGEVYRSKDTARPPDRPQAAPFRVYLKMGIARSVSFKNPLTAHRE